MSRYRRRRQRTDCPACGCARATRRTFLGGLIAALAATTLWPRQLFAKKIALSLDMLPKLKQVGGWTAVKVKGRTILFIRDSAKSVRAVHAFCTHKQTPLTYSKKHGLIVCPEHGSRFTFAGKVLKGPAEKALSPIYGAWLDLRKNRVIIKL